VVTENVEQRLEEIRARIKNTMIEDDLRAAQLLAFYSDVPWLLELVTGLRTEIKCDRERLEEAQERVQELEWEYEEYKNAMADLQC